MDQPIFTPRRTLKAVIIGAGASGLLAAYKIQRNFDDFELTVFEKNAGVSGTWFENRYPGCACDIPSHSYTYSFEPKPDWSHTFATSEEIYGYFNDFSTRYNLGKYIKLNHQVSKATWNEEEGLWYVEATNTVSGEVLKTSCHVLINAGGILNSWRWPAIPGLQRYQGKLVHSAAWDQDLVLEGKVVGLIGNGSSGIQILPAIKDKVKHLVTFIREPTYVSPPFSQESRTYTAEDHALFTQNPQLHLEMRQTMEQAQNGSFGMFTPGTDLQVQRREYVILEMKRKLQNPDLEKLLIPTWSLGCRRLTPGVNYLESLTDPNVEVVYGEITNITEKGVVMENGKEYAVDVLICATGFDTTFKPRFPLRGSTGELLSEVWKDEPRGYLGIAAHNYPNYFMTLGPNCPIGNGPCIPNIEAEVEYICNFLAKFQKENIKSFDVKKEPIDAFCAWKDDFMKNKVWAEECRSWYKAGSIEGKVAALWPGSTLHYLEALKTPRYEDWTWTYQPNANMFSFLGDGFSSAEKRTKDLSYYIRNGDDSAVDPCLKAVDPVVDPRLQEKLDAEDESLSSKL